ncbi:DUF1194 domain-containing protein [Palleronia caenipelagi]|uniref:DUF1194 domain-containing protein n=1 Tax=Palleronia caenipelagi TaxID=2489174 RepID=UPI001FEB7574|nr:DUF1194 domain-containing protein [Palleronia caenipelagi]
MALLIGMDISSSVDAHEDRLQRQGLAAALRHPDVQEAALALPNQPVAISVFEWSGRWQQDLVADWRLIRTPADLGLLGDDVSASRRSYADFPTAVGYALGYARTRFDAAPDCLFQTLDLSGDGRNNEGFEPDLAYRHFDFSNITVNGLPILEENKDVEVYYTQKILHGPGAFAEVAERFEDIEHAMTRKLVRELGVSILGTLR